MSAQRASMVGVGAAATLAMCLALPGVIWAHNGPPENKSGEPIKDILPHIEILNNNLNNKKHAASEPDAIGPCGGSKRGGRHSPGQTGLSLSCMASRTVTGKRASCGRPPRR